MVWFRFERLFIYSCDFSQPLKMREASIKADIAFIGRDLWNRYGHLQGLPQGEHILVRLARGDELAMAYDNKRVLSFFWIAYKKAGVQEIEATFLVSKGECYFYDAYTFLEWRGLNLYPYLLSCGLRYVREKGFSRAFIFVSSKNRASQRGVEKTSFSKSQVVYFFKFSSKKILYYRRQELHFIPDVR
jgi:hypothetical protein